MPVFGVYGYDRDVVVMRPKVDLLELSSGFRNQDRFSPFKNYIKSIIIDFVNATKKINKKKNKKKIKKKQTKTALSWNTWLLFTLDRLAITVAHKEITLCKDITKLLRTSFVNSVS